MERIVDGILFKGQRVADAWDVRTWRANGVMERSARSVIAWEEVGPAGTLPMTREEYRAYLPTVYDGKKLLERLAELDQEEDDRKAASIQKSAQRAKQMCRRLIIAGGFDELLTLTYRENQGDRELCKHHFKLWVMRMKDALGDFQYCASFERQERGAMHVHVACRRLPKLGLFGRFKVKAWRLGTQCWRGVVKVLGGLCFVGGKNRKGNQRHKKMALAKIAQYVSKYIMKDYADSPSGSNRYSRTNSVQLPKAELLRLTQCSFRELIELTFEAGEGDVIVSHRVGEYKDSLWLVTEALQFEDGDRRSRLVQGLAA